MRLTEPQNLERLERRKARFWHPSPLHCSPEKRFLLPLHYGERCGGEAAGVEGEIHPPRRRSIDDSIR